MIRLAGVLTGSALAIALLLLVLGVPEIAREPVEDSRAVPDESSVVTAPGAPSPREAPPENEQEAVTEPQTVALPVVEPVAEAVPAPAPQAAAADPQPETMATETISEPEVHAQHWYAFWSPFRSRIAADGFVSELSRTTGLDYRVVKLKPGVFEVAVAYTDDADIEDKLMRISAATGLDMSGS